MSVEPKVHALDELRAEASKYDDYLRQLRLGRGIEMTHMRFRAGVFGGGWLSESKPEPLPDGMEGEFYVFLSKKLSKIGQAIREAEAEIATYQPAGVTREDGT